MKSVTTVESESDSITLKKGTKGFQWEIKCYGNTIDAIIEKIDSANKKLKETYGDKEE